MQLETLRVTWKMVTRAGYGRTKKTYCRYVAENSNHKHKLRTVHGTKLFDILEKTVVSHKPLSSNRFGQLVFIDAAYLKGKLIFITNFRTF